MFFVFGSSLWTVDADDAEIRDRRTGGDSLPSTAQAGNKKCCSFEAVMLGRS